MRTALNQDAFYGVRQEASRALRSIHTEEALTALLGSTQQTDARVRQQVVEDLGGFYDEKALSALRQVLDREKNPGILASAIRDLGGYAQPELHGLLLKQLESNSYRNGLADAAIAALRSQDDPQAIGPLLDTLAQKEAAFSSRGFAQGLGTLAYLARKQESKDAVREFLLARVNHKKTHRAVGGLERPGHARRSQGVGGAGDLCRRLEKQPPTRRGGTGHDRTARRFASRRTTSRTCARRCWTLKSRIATCARTWKS